MGWGCPDHLSRELISRESGPSDKGGGGGGGKPDPEKRGGPPPPPIQTLRNGEAQSPKNIFSALRTSVWSKNKGGRAPQAPPLDPPMLMYETYDN